VVVATVVVTARLPPHDRTSKTKHSSHLFIGTVLDVEERLMSVPEHPDTDRSNTAFRANVSIDRIVMQRSLPHVEQGSIVHVYAWKANERPRRWVGNYGSSMAPVKGAQYSFATQYLTLNLSSFGTLFSPVEWCIPFVALNPNGIDNVDALDS